MCVRRSSWTSDHRGCVAAAGETGVHIGWVHKSVRNHQHISRQTSLKTGWEAQAPSEQEAASLGQILKRPEGLKVGYWGTRRWKPVPEETARGLRFAGEVVSLVQLPDALVACMSVHKAAWEAGGWPCLVGLAHFCLGCSDLWIGWYRPGLSTPWSEHPVRDMSPGSLGHPDQANALGVNLVYVQRCLLGSDVASH